MGLSSYLSGRFSETFDTLYRRQDRSPPKTLQGTIAYPTKREISDSEVAGDGRGYVIRSFRRVASHALGHLENGQATI